MPLTLTGVDEKWIDGWVSGHCKTKSFSKSFHDSIILYHFLPVNPGISPFSLCYSVDATLYYICYHCIFLCTSPSSISLLYVIFIFACSLFHTDIILSLIHWITLSIRFCAFLSSFWKDRVNFHVCALTQTSLHAYLEKSKYLAQINICIRSIQPASMVLML